MEDYIIIEELKEEQQLSDWIKLGMGFHKGKREKLPATSRWQGVMAEVLLSYGFVPQLLSFFKNPI